MQRKPIKRTPVTKSQITVDEFAKKEGATVTVKMDRPGNKIVEIRSGPGPVPTKNPDGVCAIFTGLELKRMIKKVNMWERPAMELVVNIKEVFPGTEIIEVKNESAR